MKTNMIYSAIGIVTCAVAASLAYAAVIVDDNGIGFVGKGDVQDIFGWNNSQLQAAADDVQFRASLVSITTQELTWTCTNTNNSNIQERARTVTTTTSKSGVISSVARVRKQVSGFNLNGFGGAETEETTVETEGPAFGSCPGGPWTLTSSSAGEPETEILDGGLEVSGDGGATWQPLPITPEEEL